MHITRTSRSICTNRVSSLLVGLFLIIFCGQSISETIEHNRRIGVDANIAKRAVNTSGNSQNTTNRRILVRFRDGVLNTLKVNLHQTLGSRVITRAHKSVSGLQVVEAPPGKDIRNVIRRYKNDPSVLYAEPDYKIKFKVIPDDTSFPELWGLNNTGQTGGLIDADINAPEAWDINQGDSNVVVAIIDTGVDLTHQDLIDNIWINPGEIAGNGIDDDGNGYIDDIHGIDAGDNDSDPTDTYGHGTHIAGTIGASGNNNLGVAGVNWNVSIIACKILSSTSQDLTTFVSDAVQCLDYLYDLKVNQGVNIVATNNSWGWLGEPSQTLMDAIQRQSDAGILFVAAAGNDATNTDETPDNPSSYYIPNIISVAASTHTDQLAGFSNRGRRTVHVAAPGEDILSTLPGSGTGGSTPPAQNPHDEILLDDVETGAGGWSAQAPWGITTLNSYSPVSSWTDSPGGNYNNDLNSSLTSPVIDLSGYVGQTVYLGFYANAQIEYGFDNLYIEVSNNSVTWATLHSITGASDGWEFFSIAIPAQHLTNTFQFRFRLNTDFIVTDDGVYIDDIGIGTTPFVPEPGAGSNTYGSASGTSMATPHVVGLAALLKAQFPAYSANQLKNLVVSSGTPLGLLSNNTISGRRIRAFDSDNTGGLSCVNQTVTSRLQPTTDFVGVNTGTSLGISMLNINCAEPAGSVDVFIPETGDFVTLLDNGMGYDQSAGDGIYSAEISLETLGLQNATIQFPDSTTVYATSVYVNSPPVANAGEDQIVSMGDIVTLNGSATDSDGTIVSYVWAQTSGDTVTLNNPNTPDPSFTAPQVSSPTALIFELTVSDNSGDIDTDQIVVMVNNSESLNIPPTANAGADQSVDEGSMVQLNGNGADSDGSIVSYSWNQISGPSVSLDNPAIPNPAFTAPQVNSDSLVIFELTVTDNNGDSDTDQVVVTISDVPPPNSTPVANAGTDQSVDEGSIVNLNGSGTDSDGSIVNYSWRQVSGEAVSLSDTGVPAPSFVAPQVSTTVILVFELTVTDNDGGVGADQVIVTVNDITPPNSLPIADAGLVQRVAEGALVNLIGNGIDNDGSIAGYSWRQVDGDSVVLNGADTQYPSFTAPQVDATVALTFELTVTDDAGGTGSDQVIILVDDVPPLNTAPVANAGPDQNVEEGDSVALTGSGTDSDGTIVSYSWSQISGSAVTLNGSDTATPDFTAPQVDSNSALTFELTVTDNLGQTGTDQVVIIVNDIPLPSQSPSNSTATGGGGGGGGGSFGLLFALLVQLIALGRWRSRRAPGFNC